MTASVSLPANATEPLRACRGKRARLRVVKISFNGFEQVELLVPVVVLDDGEVLAPALGDELLKARLRDSTAAPNKAIDDALLEDATDGILFSIQSSVDAAEHSRFERAQRQAERFVEDRLMVLKRRRRTLVERLDQAQLRRDGAAGSEARTAAERAVVTAQIALDEIEGSVARLEQRDDPTFRTFQDHIQQRRYAPPRVEHVFDMDLVIE